MGPEVRSVEPTDVPAVIELLGASLGWVPDDQHEAFFRWKHHENPAGPSLAWVAVEEGRILAFRTFLRWELRRGAESVRAVRAVDTATHPDAQGRGLFRMLTMHAVEAAREDGVAFVFNTPNTQSRPGYLKMGWRDVGRLPVAMRPRSPIGVTRMARARRPADKWSMPTDVGVAASEAFDDVDGVTRLLERIGTGPLLETNRTPAHLAWRYGFGPLHYRVELVDGASIDGGVLVFRLRRRGPAVEAVLAEVLAPERGAARRAVTRLLRRTGADYAIGIHAGGARHAGLARVPRQGPRLTWRSVTETDMPALDGWALTLGDIELL
jgi:GNAT superfamily N-acetyltransferase